jgi:ribosomal protein S18 acetylase RimI-like enzyme
MTINYSLRPATEDDYEFLYHLHAAAMGEYVAATWGWEESWQREYFAEKWDPSKRQIIQVNGRDAGVLVVSWRSDEIYLELIELLPIYQGRGVGTAVLQDLIARSREQQLPLVLHVLKANKPARRLYQRLGFHVVAEEEVRYKMVRIP